MSKYPLTGTTNITPADFDWLTGSWKGYHGTDRIEEHWSSADGGTRMGMFRWLREDKVWFYEFILLEQDGEHVVLRFNHFYPGLKMWEEKDRPTEFLLVQYSPEKAVFLQTNKPGPWLIYHQESAEQLVVYFETEDEPVEPGDYFIYERIP
jgi:hypothetical protein